MGANQRLQKSALKSEKFQSANKQFVIGCLLSAVLLSLYSVPENPHISPKLTVHVFKIIILQRNHTELINVFLRTLFWF